MIVQESKSAADELGVDEKRRKKEVDDKVAAVVHPGEFGSGGKLRILQVTDLHIMDIDRAFGGTDVPDTWRATIGDSSSCLQRTLDLIRKAITDQQIHLVVMTGDIVDARSAKTLDEFIGEFKPLSDLCADLSVPWLYIPGNHEDGHGESYAREDLQKLFSLPGSLCSPGSFDSFDQTHVLHIGGDSGAHGVVLLQLVDAAWTPKICHISHRQVEMARRSIQDIEVLTRDDGKVHKPPVARVAFAHEPFDSFADATIPLVRGITSYPPKQRMEDSGYLQLLQSEKFHALFAGHNHHNDFIRWSGSVDEMWLGHGRCGSFFPPSTWEGTYPLPFDRGARVFEVDAQEHKMTTWIYDEQLGVDMGSLLTRPL